MKTGNGQDLGWLLDYELTQSTRHRRFVSLVMLSANGSTDKIENGKATKELIDMAYRRLDTPKPRETLLS